MRNKLVIGILLFLMILSLGFLVSAQDEEFNYDKFLRQGGMYSRIARFLHGEKGRPAVSAAEPQYLAGIFSLDLAIGMLSLFLAILILDKPRAANGKGYLWFLLALNIGWFVVLLLFKILWIIIGFLILNLRPDLQVPLMDFFGFAVIIASGLVFIWIIARTFEFNFWGAFASFSISQVFYFLLIALVLAGLPKDARFSVLAKERLGPRPVVHSYLSDIQKIVFRGDIISLARLRLGHL